MSDVYQNCPRLENDRYLMRFISADDCDDLLKVYSDIRSVPFFNSDNCHGDNFYYTTAERMKKAIDFWIDEYHKRYYVRWTIVDKSKNESVGTIELFNRRSEDYFDNCGILRLDLRSDYELCGEIKDILSLIIPRGFDLFECGTIASKAVSEAAERIKALSLLGFVPTQEKLIGQDGREYDSYYILKK